MEVNVCGIKHKIVECEDGFNSDATHFGQMDFLTCIIKVNKDMHEDMKREAICHEMVHGMLTHLGYYEQAQNENFVQALANAIMQGFDIKPV